jgi:hypothetical protein
LFLCFSWTVKDFTADNTNRQHTPAEAVCGQLNAYENFS